MNGYQDKVVKDRCLCGVHVNSATKIVAVFSIVFSAMSILLAFYEPPTTGHSFSPERHSFNVITQKTTSHSRSHHFHVLIFSIIQLVVSIILLVSAHKKKPSYYWPFLIYTIVAFSLYCLIFVILGSLYIYIVITAPELKLTLGLVSLLIMSIFGLFLYLYIYFFFIVVNRSRRVLELTQNGSFDLNQSQRQKNEII